MIEIAFINTKKKTRTILAIGHGSATVQASDSATVIAYRVIDPNCLKSSMAVLIDRSTHGKVIVHIGK